MANKRKQLFILPFDHRHSFEKDIFEIHGRPPTVEESTQISFYKTIIFEGFKKAIDGGVPKESAGILVDEQFGSTILRNAQSHGFITACSVEKSGQKEFEFEYGDDFGAHLLRTHPDYVKALIRYNSEGDMAMNERQVSRLLKLSNFCLEHSLDLMVELLVPPTLSQSFKKPGDSERYNSEVRPKAIVAAIKELQAKGVEPKIWKIEGVSELSDCDRIAKQACSQGRKSVGLIVLGGGEDTQTLKQWLKSAAMTEGYIGFAIGRTIWEKPLKNVREKQILSQDAAEEISQNFKIFCDLWLRVAKMKDAPERPLFLNV